MVAFGFGEVFGGFFHGLLIDKIGSKKTVFINVLIIIIMTSLSLYSLYNKKFDWKSFLMCFVWGYQDGSLNIFLF
jgi:predicted MFS family arabinose efflux permease